MKIWFQIWKDAHLVQDITVEDYEQDTRTHKIMNALDKACYEFDLSRPIWLDKTVTEFKRHAKARFYQDSFVEEVSFDYLQIEVLEEDY